jgi:hypothetical protein
VLESTERESKFGRNTWGLLCLELWHAEFHDRSVRLPEPEGPVTLEDCSTAGAGAVPASV